MRLNSPLPLPLPLLLRLRSPLFSPLSHNAVSAPYTYTDITEITVESLSLSLCLTLSVSLTLFLLWSDPALGLI